MIQKTASLIFCLLVAGITMSAQQNKLKMSGLSLENYEYPYEVHYLPLNSQNQTLRMAYMDVQPEKPNGKSIMLLHGKNFNGAYWESTASATVPPWVNHW